MPRPLTKSFVLSFFLVFCGIAPSSAQPYFERSQVIQEIVDAVGTSQSNISQHLAILREKGVLLTRKDANRVFYRVGDQRTLQLVVMMREVFCGVES